MSRTALGLGAVALVAAALISGRYSVTAVPSAGGPGYAVVADRLTGATWTCVPYECARNTQK